MAQTERVNVQLGFTADTKRAQQQLMDLQRQLSQIANTPITANNLGIAQEIQKASKAALELQSHLNAAINVDTGKLDLGKLSSSLDLNKLKQYRNTLNAMGPEGQRAFNAFATSVANAEVPLKRSSKWANDLWISLKNTAKWQISSSIMQGFLKSISTAYNYAKDLNESLNNIRIVTGYSADEMAKFAVQANKAAKALSTTTTAYTDAALIYYQQGLSDSEILQRTETTIKMANVTGQAAQDVSDQMTAIWNNFDNGSKSLEYYADVITKLGAETASSSDEIAQGLEKFAAVSETVGLSYEYATASLATVTATTRQSADVVGNAFKTLFSRVQGLNLGETLDDGTTLNKYSAALNAVGISIKDQNGQIKEMDTILDEMGSKWDTLGKDQQLALAQTVAGVRQYTQLIALMDNWDTFQKNLSSAKDASGTLQEQQEIYEESWQAASERVRAALESIYDSLIDDEGFIDLLNTIEDIVKTFDMWIDSVGGLNGVLAILGATLTKIFSQQLATSLNNIKYNFFSLTGKAQKDAANYKKQVLSQAIFDNQSSNSAEDRYRADIQKKIVDFQTLMIDKGEDFTEQQRTSLQLEIDRLHTLEEYYSLMGRNVDKAEAEVEAQREDFKANFSKGTKKKLQGKFNGKLAGVGESLLKGEGKSNTNFLNKSEQRAAVQAYGKITEKEFNTLDEKQKKGLTERGINVDNFQSFTKSINSAAQSAKYYEDSLTAAYQAQGKSAEEARKLAKSFMENADANEKARIAQDLVNEEAKETLGIYGNLNKTLSKTEHIVNAAQAFSSLAAVANMVKGIFQTWKNPDLSVGEKLLQITMSLASAIPMVVMALNNETIAIGAETLAKKLNIATTIESISAKTGETIATKKHTAALLKDVAVRLLAKAIANPLATAAIIAGIVATTAAIWLSVKAHNADAKAAKEAAMAADDLAAASEKARSEMETFRSEFDNYKSAIETLDSLKESMEGYGEAVKNVNDQTLQLLEKYPELASLDNLFEEGHNEKGVYQLNTDTIENYIARQEQEAQKAQYAALMGGAYKSQAQVKSDTTDLRREMNNISIMKDDDNYTSFDFGNDITKNINEWAGLSEEKFEEKAREYAASLGDLNTTTQLSESEQYRVVQKLKGYQKDINTLANNSESAANQMDNVSKILADMALGKDADKEQSEQWQKDYKEKADSFEVHGINRASRVGSDKQLQDLLEQAGIKKEDVAKNSIIAEKGVLYLQYANGEKESLEAVKQRAQNNQATNYADENARIIINEQLKDYGIDLNDDVSLATSNSLLARLGNVVEGQQTTFINTLVQGLEGKSALEQEEIINQALAMVEEFDYKANLKEEAEKYDLEEEYINYHAEETMKAAEEAEKAGGIFNNVSKDLKDNAKMVNAVTVANARMNKGLLDLAENFESYRYTLENSDKGSLEYVSALKDISDAMNDVLGLDDVELSNSFIDNTKNLDLMAKAAEGNAEALEELRAAAAKDIIANIEVDDEATKRSLEDWHNNMQKHLDNQNLTIGMEFNDEETLNNFNNLVKDAKMTTEQVQDYFNALGYIPEIEYDEVDQENTYSGHIPHVVQDGDSFKVEPVKYEYTVTEKVKVPKIKSLTYNGPAGSTINVGELGKASSGAAAKTYKPSKKSDTVDRYKEVDDSIDDLTDAMEDANKQADRLFGANRIKYLEKEKGLLDQQIKLLQKKNTEAKKYLTEDKEALENNKYGIKFEFDENGNILNSTAIMEDLWEQLHDKEVELAGIKDSNAASAYEESNVKPIQDKINELKDLISQYDETRELSEDLENQINDAFYSWQDKNFEILNYKIELDIQINDDELKRLDFLMSRYENDFTKSAERAALLFGSDGSGKVGVTKRSLTTNAAALGVKSADGWNVESGTLYQALKNNEISQSQYIEGLRNYRDAIYDNLSALQEYDDAMMSFYGDTLAAAQESISKQIDKMGRMSSILDHYTNIMGLLGKQADYEAMGDFYNAQKQISRDSLDAVKANYDSLLKERKDLSDKLIAIQEEGNEKEIQSLQKQLDDLDETIAETQDEVLSKTKTWIESVRAEIENNMKKIAKTLEDTLTKGLGFDTLMSEFDRLNTRQEEYYTETNKLYETNKMLRDIDKQIDNTSNKASKQKLSNFKSEVQGLQEKNQLSKFELEIQQAKYDLLLAEIALEEAQNAKSTVRLTRDSEGNFGYVYTADQDKIDDAMQNVEDKENALYNKSLDGQQEYTEKYLQAQQDMNDKLAELQDQYFNQGAISKEEYEAGIAKIQEHYYGENGILTTYSKLYNIAVQADSKATADYWAKEYGSMTQNTEDWKIAVNKYIKEVSGQTKLWAEISVQANQDTKGALNDSETATKNLTVASEALRKKIMDGENSLIKAMEKEMAEVGKVTDAYGLQRDEVQGLIDDYILLIEKVDEALIAQSNMEQSTAGNNLPNPTLPSNGSYGTDDIIKAQKFIGVEADGKWGKISSTKAEELGFYSIGQVLQEIERRDNFSIEMEKTRKAQYFIGVKTTGKWDANSSAKAEELGFYSRDQVLEEIERREKKAATGYDTGGYTGEWGPEGKLAFLHQKELVLNAQDTENMLKVVSLIRDVMSMIDFQAASSSLFSASAFTTLQPTKEALEQRVEIKAEFPNATDKYEIEAAFESLVNKASQYANRKF